MPPDPQWKVAVLQPAAHSWRHLRCWQKQSNAVADSPLAALIKDQVLATSERNVTAANNGDAKEDAEVAKICEGSYQLAFSTEAHLRAVIWWGHAPQPTKRLQHTNNKTSYYAIISPCY